MGQSGSLIGTRRGILNIVEAVDKRETYGNNSYRFYRVVCDCGNEKIMSSRFLTPKTKSCGCAKKNGGVSQRKGSAADYSARVVFRLGYKNGCSFEQFMKLSQQNCFYCGCLPSNHYNAVKRRAGNSQEWADQGTFTYNGLDRIDSSKDHSESNVVSCCKTCNWMKNKSHYDDFLNHIKRIFIHMNLKPE